MEHIEPSTKHQQGFKRSQTVNMIVSKEICEAPLKHKQSLVNSCKKLVDMIIASKKSFVDSSKEHLPDKRRLNIAIFTLLPFVSPILLTSFIYLWFEFLKLGLINYLILVMNMFINNNYHIFQWIFIKIIVIMHTYI